MYKCYRRLARIALYCTAGNSRMYFFWIALCKSNHAEWYILRDPTSRIYPWSFLNFEFWEELLFFSFHAQKVIGKMCTWVWKRKWEGCIVGSAWTQARRGFFLFSSRRWKKRTSCIGYLKAGKIQCFASKRKRNRTYPKEKQRVSWQKIIQELHSRIQIFSN